MNAGHLETWRLVGSSLQEYTLLVKSANLDQACAFLPGGAYTTLRTYSGLRVLRLESHFHRLEESACLVGRILQVDRQAVRQALREILRKRGEKNQARLRLVLDLEDKPGVIYILVQTLHSLPKKAYERGVAAVTTRQLSRQTPKAKLTSFIAQAGELRAELPPGVNEALMLNEDGYILEGLSSNFFAVRAGEIWTAEQGVLDGITRQQVLACVRDSGLPLCLQPVNIGELPVCQEVFITSASRSVLPVVKIDELGIGAGKPGPATKQLAEAFASRLVLDLEPV